jgi:hypothetical protein
MFDWLFGRSKSAFGETNPNNPSFNNNSTNLLLAEFGAFNIPIAASNPEDLERDLPEIHARDQRRGQILDAIAKLPESQTALAFWVDACVASQDGDDRGVCTADHIDRQDTIPIDPEIDEIVSETIDRIFSTDTIQAIAERILSRGDEFRHAEIAKKQIVTLHPLPCWQTFRREEMGKLEGYYVKKFATDRDSLRYDPSNTFHFRFKPLRKYGRSLFESSQHDAEYLLKRLLDLDFAARASAIDPLCHEMPACATQEYLIAYKAAYQAKAATQPITDFFLQQGAKIYRASGGNTPNIASIMGALNFNQVRLLMATQVPFYLLGIRSDGAKDISGEPALAFSRAVSTLRAAIGGTMREVINLQLTLSGIPPDRQKYRLIWPKIIVNPYSQPQDQTDENDTGDTEK